MSMQILFLKGRNFEWHSTKQMPNINQTFYLFIYLFTLTWIALWNWIGVRGIVFM